MVFAGRKFLKEWILRSPTIRNLTREIAVIFLKNTGAIMKMREEKN
jgi:hypothetical protein